MSDYNFIFKTMVQLFSLEVNKKYSFSQVCDVLKNLEVPKEQEIDLRFKLHKGSISYTKRFEELENKKLEIKQLKKDNEVLQKNLDKTKKQYENMKKRLVVRVDDKLRRIYRKMRNKIKK